MRIEQAITLLKRCTDQRDLKQGRHVHSLLEQGGLLGNNILVGNKLIHMYGRCAGIEDSLAVFNALRGKQVFSWTILITAYLYNGYISHAMKTFEKMPQRNQVTWNALVSAYAERGHIDTARELVYQMPEPSASAFTVLIKALSEAGRIEQARMMFNAMTNRDVVTWNVMMAAYSQYGDYEQALELFRVMDCQPTHVTFLAAMDACSNLRLLAEARAVHARIAKTGLMTSYPSLASSAINMFGRCGSVEEARQVFDKLPERNSQAWNAMLIAYAENGHLEEATSLFDQIPERTVVSWNSMITIYVQAGRESEALRLFRMIDLEGFQTNTVTFTAAIDACTSVAQGEVIWSEMVEIDELATVALIKLYARCGSLRKARATFDAMVTKSSRSVVSWNTMIGSYAHNAQSKEALDLFMEMAVDGTSPNSITFITVLTTCSRQGQLEDVRSQFLSMSLDYGFIPDMDHYVCLLDALGRSGRVHEAIELINTMPFEPDATAWRTLLGACKTQRSHSVGFEAAKQSVQVDSRNVPSAYVLLSNMYAESGLQEAEDERST